jgi:hypothetical protein
LNIVPPPLHVPCRTPEEPRHEERLPESPREELEIERDLVLDRTIETDGTTEQPTQRFHGRVSRG